MTNLKDLATASYIGGVKDALLKIEEQISRIELFIGLIQEQLHVVPKGEGADA